MSQVSNKFGQPHPSCHPPTNPVSTHKIKPVYYIIHITYNRASLGNKTKWTQILDSESLAAHPLLCYRFSMTSTSFEAGVKQWMNRFAFEAKLSSGINHFFNWMLMLGNQANFLVCAPPRIKGFFQSFPQSDLALVSDFIFPRKLPNPLIELWELFYHNYLDKQGVNFTKIWPLINKKLRFMH